MRTIFESCTPRPDVLAGVIRESDFAADLAQVLRGEGPTEYRDPTAFFANTHPTAGLQRLLENVCRRVSGVGGAPAIFRLDTQYGGGKTHALIGLSHVARTPRGIPNISEFVSPELLPETAVRVAAFDGENADPVNGRGMGSGIRAFTPWGELAYALGGADGYEHVRRSDEQRRAPGADTIKELFAGQPAVILLDELSIYLRKVRGREEEDQLTPFLTGLFKAVESADGVVLVFTLALGKGGMATDAYSAENQQLGHKLAEAMSVAGRKATLLDPTAEDETVKVLRRRLFSQVDEDAAREAVDAYRSLWKKYAADLPAVRTGQDRAADLLAGYPFHPALMDVLTDKLSTLANFQRVRGMLRLVTQAVGHLWQERPAETYAIHLHHLNPGVPATRNEVVTRLEQAAYDPAIRNDVTSGTGSSTAEQVDAQHFAGLAPLGSFVARTILWHSFAFNDTLKGTSQEELRFAVAAPGVDVGFINEARQKFQERSAYLDDRPAAPLRFLAEANLTRIIAQQEDHVDREEAHADLRDRIRGIFGGATFELVPFAAGPEDVGDDIGNGRARLVVLGYDAESIRSDRLQVPPLVERIFRTTGTQGKPRHLQNHLVFLVADEHLKEDMKQAMVHRLALKAMNTPARLEGLADHQREKVRELYQKSDAAVAIAIQRCYRHLFFPSRNRVEGALVDLAHTAFDIPSTADRPGLGQSHVERALDDNRKILRDSDHPPAPTYVRDNTPLRKGQLSTAALRNEFRCDPRLPILLGDANFLNLIRKGIDEETYVYRAGELLLGKGDPWADILIDDNAIVFTSTYAREHGIWPRPAVPQPSPGPGGSAGGSVGATGGAGGGVAPAGGPGGAPPPPPPPGVIRLTAEAPLREALTRIWEQARSKKVVRLARLSLRVFDRGDAFKLLSAGRQVPNAERSAEVTASYETASGSTLDAEFKGSLDDAEPFKEFLETQFRGAKDTDLDARYTFAFTGGLEVASDAPEKITERLARFAAGTAYVTADAESEPQ